MEMLQKFKVKGFKNFASQIEFDLTAGNYSFNDSIVKIIFLLLQLYMVIMLRANQT